jgi:hypothetical protein
MDFREFDNPLLYADPDYGEELYAAWGSHDLSDRDNLSVPMLDDDDDEGAWLNDEGAPFKLTSPATQGGSDLWERGESFTPGLSYEEEDACDPAILHNRSDLAIARPSTIRRLVAAAAAIRLRLQSDCAEARLEAELRSFTLNNSFLCTGPGSLPSRLPEGRSIAITGDEIVVWLEQSTTLL